MKIRTSCITCNRHVEDIVDLGWQPLADLFIKAENYYRQTDLYPLQLQLCMHCNNIQTACVTDPQKRYNNQENPYSYTSGGSKSSRDYWNKFADYVSPFCNGDANVLEIGSNDGYLLNQIKKYTPNVMGVDASYWAANLSQQAYRDIPVLREFFTWKLAMEHFTNKFDLIIANNIVNHVDDPVNFMEGIALSLKKNGLFIFEVPDWSINVNYNEFDTIYHEHVSYFTVTYAKKLAEIVGLQLLSAERVSYHGGSLRLIMGRSHHVSFPDTVDELIANETHLFDPMTYHLHYQPHIETRKYAFLEKFYGKLASGHNTAFAIGAAAKGNTILHYYGLNHTTVDYVTDVSPYKIGKFTPHSLIPIRSDDELGKYENPLAIIMARNLPASLAAYLKTVNPTVTLMTP